MTNINPEFIKYQGKGYTGLVNLGNTCFLNSCIQVLNHAYELVELIHSDKTQRYLKRDIPDAAIVQEWTDLRQVMWTDNGVVSPNKFIHYVHQLAEHKKKDIFTGWAQNDLTEFLFFTIECMHNSISRPIHMKIQGNPQNKLDNQAIQCYSMLKKIYDKEYSEIMDIFYGIYVSEITSIDGSISHAIKPEHYFILDLPIPENNETCSLYDCFNIMVKSEILEGDNAWYNEQTNQKENIQKRITFWNFPKILVITLKRFSYDGKKLNNYIQFPEDLDLSKYVAGYNAPSYQYELFGICNHVGNVMGGHYTSFVKNATNEWIHYNDSNVEIVKENIECIISPMAYCLFYRKKNN